ncbi:DUF4132 domain-containing protein [Clostridium scatologenes]|uniref:Molybdate metabolism regulator n=1 Tax=Clostridium scatologenes TaxID=1548 RepID=A0A0E3GQ91_CLOSL|nr:DUF4132 domain-containing protein [Clostridium scatologenes]AKA68161.1 molybdate metabolism regulator [Clostridium scatologenes]
MNMKEHLLNRIMDTLEELNVCENIVEKLEDYLEDEIDENEFLNILPDIKFYSIPDDNIKKTVHALSSIRKYKNKDYMRKYVNMLFKMGGPSASLIVNRSYYWFSELNAKEFIDAGIEKYIVLILYIEPLTYDFNRLERRYFKIIYDICNENPEVLIKAAGLVKTNQKILLYSIYCSCKIVERDDRYAEFLKVIEDDFKDSIDNLYENKMPEDLVKKIQDFINRNDHKLPESVIDKVKMYKFNDYLFKFLIGLSSLNASRSATLKKIFRFFTMVDFKFALNSAYAIMPVASCYSDTVNNFDTIFEIPSKYHIAWYAEKFTGNENATKVLSERLKKDKKTFEDAIDLCEGIAKNYLISFMLDDDKKMDYIKSLENDCVNIFSEILREDDVDEGDISIVEAFLNGTSSFEEVKNTIYSINPKELNSWRVNSDLTYLFSILCKKIGCNVDIYERSIVILSVLKYQRYILNLASVHDKQSGNHYSKEKFQLIFDILRKYNVSVTMKMKLIDKILTSYDYENNIANAMTDVLKDIIIQDGKEVIENIKNISADSRCTFIEYIFKIKSEENMKAIFDEFASSSKKVKEKIIELFTNDLNNVSYIDYIINKLKSQKQGEREVAIKIFSKWYDKNISQEIKKLIKDSLSYALEVEKSQKIRTLLMEVLDIEQNHEEKELKDDDLIKNLLKGNKKKSLSWLEFESLPKVKLKENNNYCEEDYLKAILLCYSASSNIGISVDGDRFAEKLNKSDMKLFANEVFDRWFEKGAESKKRWVLGFSAIHGEDEIVIKLEKDINNWAKNSRGAIASEAVKALALNGSSSALLVVDGISRKFKYKQVKKAAAEALDFAAEQMGVDREELSDKIVPNLGFDINGERIFDYGSRKFTVNLTPDLSIEVYDENKKKLKNLPSPGKRDDEEKAKEAHSEFKTFKKQLKTTVSTQTTRMDLALSNDRKWTKTTWMNLFVENPIMHQFAIGLIWGTYRNSKLVDTFRYMEDGSFNTKDEDEFQLLDDCSIGLVHPLELNDEDLTLWNEQLENYEIVQPIGQLNRKTFTLTEKEKSMNYVDRFGGKIVNGLSLAGKLMNYGWYRGSVQDAGGYYELYKEDKNLSIGVELSFEGLYVGDENEDTTIYILRFYNSGTVERGSYIYDEIKKEHLLSLSKVPKKYFSEILHQVDNALSSSTLVNENWRKEIKLY